MDFREQIIDSVSRFLDWSSRKIALHLRATHAPSFQAGEIWWASLGENIGSEMNGKHMRFERPVIVVRKLSNDMMLIVPCTTSLKNGSWYFPYHFDGQELRAIVAHVRAISNRRLLRKAGQMDGAEFAGLRDALINLIKTEPPDRSRGSSDSLAARERRRTM